MGLQFISLLIKHISPNLIPGYNIVEKTTKPTRLILAHLVIIFYINNTGLNGQTESHFIFLDINTQI